MQSLGIYSKVSLLETAKQTTSRYTKDNEKGPNYIIMESHQTTREEIKRRNRVAIQQQENNEKNTNQYIAINNYFK